MLRVIACAAVVIAAASANAQAQKVTTVPGQDTLVVSGLGKVRLAGIAGLEPALQRFKYHSNRPAQWGKCLR